ncbi:MAG: hypothetical protein JO073_00350 [Actinobacteria bacterium]|nr:hypothetical protein [Actinomycetota bacterium]
MSAVAALFAAVLLAVPAAALAGGSPQDICKDLQEHGKLTHTYTPAQISAYESDTTIQGYCPAIVPQSSSSTPAAPTQQSGVQGAQQSSTLPFTGFRVIVVAIVGAGLLLGGTLLWAAGRRRQT